MKKRNVAIIAHVDHGKTTLVDGILKHSGMFRDNQDVSNVSMDSNDLERERGITILAKTTALDYKDVRINILDTPGHADFGGEVERIMNMVDGVILVVDAYEGAMPQTRFVLKKAFEAKVKPIVVINKVDKPSARCKQVVDEVLDLFIELGADDEQLDFKVIYASAINGTCSLSDDLSTQKEGFDPLLDSILEEIPAPKGDIDAPLQFQPALLDYNDFVGRIGIGRVHNGKIKTGEMVTCCRLDGSTKQFRVQKLFGFYGYNRVEINEAEAGESGNALEYFIFDGEIKEEKNEIIIFLYLESETITEADNKKDFVIQLHVGNPKKSSRELEKMCIENGFKISYRTICRIIKEYEEKEDIKEEKEVVTKNYCDTLSTPYDNILCGENYVTNKVFQFNSTFSNNFKTDAISYEKCSV